MNIRGAIITIDAMGAQTAIAKQTVDSQADYVLALKGNQGSLYQAATDYIDEQVQTDFTNVDVRRHTTTEAGHGRTETRTYVQLPASKTLSGFDRRPSLATLGIVISIIVREGKETVGIRYFISSLVLGVK